MKRWFASPLLSLSVFMVWLLLNGVSPGQLLLAALLAIALPASTARLRPNVPQIRHPLALAKLAVVFAYDIVVANLQVARRILGPESRIHPGFIWVPLEITNPYTITTLAGIITMTPGTLSADVSPSGKHLLVHCFHLEDAQATIDTIKHRYERPLREIFQ